MPFIWKYRIARLDAGKPAGRPSPAPAKTGIASGGGRSCPHRSRGLLPKWPFPSPLTSGFPRGLLTGDSPDPRPRGPRSPQKQGGGWEGDPSDMRAAPAPVLDTSSFLLR